MCKGGSTNTTTTSQQPFPAAVNAYTNANNWANYAANLGAQTYGGQLVATNPMLPGAAANTLNLSQDFVPFRDPALANLQAVPGYGTTAAGYGQTAADLASRYGGNAAANADWYAGQAYNYGGQAPGIAAGAGDAANTAAASGTDWANYGASAASNAGGTAEDFARSYGNQAAGYGGTGMGIAGGYGNQATAAAATAPGIAAGYGNQALGSAYRGMNAATGYGNAATQAAGSAPGLIGTYISPYTQQVVDATQAQFNNQNAIQQAGVVGNAAAQGAWGGDRSAVAQGIVAGQQQTAQAPVIAGLYQQGYQQAVQAAQQQAQLQAQTGVQAGQLGIAGAGLGATTALGAGQEGIAGAQLGAQTGIQAGQLGLAGTQQAAQAAEAAGQLGLGATGQQIQAGIQGGQLGVGAAGQRATTALGAGQLGIAGQQQATQAALGAAQQGTAANLGAGQLANQANLGAGQLNLGAGELNTAAAAGLGNLGQQNYNIDLGTLNAQIAAGGLEQQQQQAQLNVPYQQWLAAQAYPYQTAQFLANIAEGTGGLSGGTSSTTSPAASPISQALGLGIGGAGLINATGGFGNNGWATNAWDQFTGAAQDFSGGAAGAGFVGPGEASLPWFGARGGGIPHRQTGGIIPGGFAPGQPGPIGTGVPDVSLSVIPLGGGSRSPTILNPMASTGQTSTTTGGGGGGSSVVGDLGSAAGLANVAHWALPLLGLDRGGGIPHRQFGGSAPSYGIAPNPGSISPSFMPPDVSVSIFPQTQQPRMMGSGPPHPPAAASSPASQGITPVSMLSSLKSIRDLSANGGIFGSPNSSDGYQDGGTVVDDVGKAFSDTARSGLSYYNRALSGELRKEPLGNLRTLATLAPGVGTGFGRSGAMVGGLLGPMGEHPVARGLAIASPEPEYTDTKTGRRYDPANDMARGGGIMGYDEGGDVLDVHDVAGGSRSWADVAGDPGSPSGPAQFPSYQWYDRASPARKQVADAEELAGPTSGAITPPAGITPAASRDPEVKVRDQIASDMGIVPSAAISSAMPSPSDYAGQPYRPDPWLALAAAGFGAAAGRSPQAMQNIGAGALEGMKFYEQERQAAPRLNLEQAQLGLIPSAIKLRGAQAEEAQANAERARAYIDYLHGLNAYDQQPGHSLTDQLLGNIPGAAADHKNEAAPQGPLQMATTQVASANGIDPQFAVAHIKSESNFDPGAIGPAVDGHGRPQPKPLGIAQLDPETATRWGVQDPMNPQQALAGYGRYFGTLLKQTGGDYEKAAQLYGTIPQDPSRDDKNQATLRAEAKAANARAAGGQGGAGPAGTRVAQGPAVTATDAGPAVGGSTSPSGPFDIQFGSPETYARLQRGYQQIDQELQKYQQAQMFYTQRAIALSRLPRDPNNPGQHDTLVNQMLAQAQQQQANIAAQQANQIKLMETDPWVQGRAKIGASVTTVRPGSGVSIGGKPPAFAMPELKPSVDPATGQVNEQWVTPPIGTPGAGPQPSGLITKAPSAVETQREAADKEYAEAVQDAKVAQESRLPLQALSSAMENYRTGRTGPARLALGQAWQDVAQALHLKPDSELAKWVASGEIITKEGTQLGFGLARTLGQREAQMIVQQAIQTNPGMINSPQGNRMLVGLADQGLQRSEDKRNFFDQYAARNKGSFIGAADAFNQARPAERYIYNVMPPTHPPPGLDPMSSYSQTRGVWRDPQGNFYNARGIPIPQAAPSG